LKKYNMDSNKVIQQLEELFKQLKSQKIIRIIGIVLIIPILFDFFFLDVILGIIIILSSNKKIKELELQKNKLEKKLEKCLSKIEKDVQNKRKTISNNDTYLIYDYLEKENESIIEYIQQISFLETNSKHFHESLVDKVLTLKKESTKFKKWLISFNEEFVKRRKKEYHWLFEKSPFPLDDNQRTAVIVDDKHNLVVAGAGSGKTEVLTNRIAYLIERKPDTIKKEKILALAFQSKAADEIKERLKKRYDVNVEVRTFHGFGNQVLDKSSKGLMKESPQLKFSGDNYERDYSRHINFLFQELLKKPDTQNKIINYMKWFGDDEIEQEEADFETKEEFYKYKRNQEYIALDGRNVKSEAERDILNFFVTHNLNGKKIEIIYEEKAEWMKYENDEGKIIIPEPDFFFPEYEFYWEHWALDENGKVPKWFVGNNPTKEYKEGMELKKKKFMEQDKYVLIETSFADCQKKDFNSVIKTKLLHELKKKYPEQKFKFERLSYKELVERVWEECKAYVNSLAKHIGSFIVIAKTYSLAPDDIKVKLKKEKWSQKQIAFANIALSLYELYQLELKSSNKIDFCDMINLAVNKLKTDKNLLKNSYDHILIDEFQDISTQRYNLIKELMKKNQDCKLFCVGDDWQSIMGFSGANLDFFVNFKEYFPHPARTDLTINYRSVKSIVETGSEIIKHNGESQLKKKAIAKDDRELKITIFSSKHQESYRPSYWRQTARHCIDEIEIFLKQKYKPNEIMILTRIMKNRILITELKEYAKEKKIRLTEEKNRDSVRLMSVHKSKGLQAKIVFILNVDKDLYGFPCELENPDIYEPAIEGRRNHHDEEERRLFYVAITRAKEEVFIYSQKCKKSKFLNEIEKHVVEWELPF